MARIFRFSTSAVLVIALFCAGSACFGQSLSEKADIFIRDTTVDHKFSGVIFVAKNGKEIYRFVNGAAVEAWNVPLTFGTKFELASLTKQFTGMAILLLAQDGKLKVDDPISKYYSHAPEAWRGITIRQLANHTSGLPNNDLKDFTKGLCSAYTNEELLQTFRDKPLKFQPGSDWAYTNTEYYLLAYLIETLSGETYAEFLKRRIFAPLSMSDTGFSSTLAIVPHMAEGYTADGANLRHRNYYDRSLEVGAGGLYSTAKDMLLWSQALDSAKLLQPEWLQALFAPSTPGNYGFGWFIKTGPHPSQYHEGSDPGFAAFEIRYPVDHLFVIVLANREDAPVRILANGLGGLFLNGSVPKGLE